MTTLLGDDIVATVEQDKVAGVHYTGTFVGGEVDGEVFDSNVGSDALYFLVGHHQMIPGFEQEIMGAEVGEAREFTLIPERAYGERSEEAIQQFPQEQFPEGEIIVGMGIMAQSDHGPIPGEITAVEDGLVTVDFNNQMAGKTLRFSVEVVEVRDATPEELEHGHYHDPSGHHH